MEIKDIHVHTGNFNGGLYFSPEEVSQSMKPLNVSRYYFSSTSTGSVPFREVRREIEKLVSLSEGRATPFLWISPGMLRHSRDLKPYFFRIEQKFAGIKLHGLQGWNPEGKEIRRVISIARDKNLPVLLHTGEHEICRSSVYMNLCLEFPDVKIILAHGRPIDECIAVMNECENAWADTAFMGVNNIVRLRDSGLIPRVLWGSDFPVMRFFYDDISPIEYYMQNINSAKEALGENDFELLTSVNFQKFFA